jgi:uncharacterized MAPEG superfamily protein
MSMSPSSAAALITLLNIVLVALAMQLVGSARGKYGVQAPATTGHADFERVFRAHQNTLEATVMFLPCLWIAASYGNARIAAWLGAAWLFGRAWYLFAYASPTGKRGPGFIIAIAANLLLLAMGFWSLVAPLLHTG